MNSDSERHLHVMLGSLERRGPWKVPSQLDVSVMWGNAELDLREATLEPGVTTIRVNVKMGNLELVVPPGVPVEMAVNPVLANAESHHRVAPRTVEEPGKPEIVPLVHTPYRGAFADHPELAPRIRVVGTVKLGNVEVHEREIGEAVDRDEMRKELHALRKRRHQGMRELDMQDRASQRDEPSYEGLSHKERHRLKRLERRERRQRRWREIHAERAMWRKEMHSSQWVPWWLAARMRRRIFLWLAIAVVAGFFLGHHLDTRPPWWMFLVGFVGISGISGAIAFRLTRPLILVVRAAREIGDGKLDTRLDTKGHGGETYLLASALNDMASKIQTQMADQRQLLAAVSHELRTPLGHMRVLVETARDTHDLKPLDGMEREILHLDDLVGKLLASSRLEFGNLERHPLELGELVTDVATTCGVEPEHIEAIGDVVAPVDPTLVRRALANLIDNAKVHGGGAIAVRVERRASLVAIEVDDAGPGVAADRKADAFRAFVPSSKAGGLGLGLALVSRIAVAHGGGAWIQDRPGGGSRIGFSISTIVTPK